MLHAALRLFRLFAPPQVQTNCGLVSPFVYATGLLSLFYLGTRSTV